MQELAIADGIVTAISERLPGKSIASVQLEIGELSGVVADSLLFCFDLATEGTGLAGAKLEITHCRGRCSCRACGAEFSPGGPIMLCECGSADVTVLSGQELKIASVRVA
jgi:hydrogenase nickel incorporation protein HypA/HybF